MGGLWNTARYLDSLEARFGIKAQQAAAWDDYATTARNVGEGMQALHQTFFAAMGAATWQERRDMMNRMPVARQESFDTAREAAEKLLPALDAAQRSLAAAILPGLSRGRAMAGMGGRGPRPRNSVNGAFRQR